MYIPCKVKISFDKNLKNLFTAFVKQEVLCQYKQLLVSLQQFLLEQQLLLFFLRQIPGQQETKKSKQLPFVCYMLKNLQGLPFLFGKDVFVAAVSSEKRSKNWKDKLRI